MVQPRIRYPEEAPRSRIYAFDRGRAVVRALQALARPAERAAPRAFPRWVEGAAFLAGRAIFGGYFIYNGVNHYANNRMMARYAGSKGVPAPRLAVDGSGLLLLGGGLSVLTGAWPKLGAAMLSTFLLSVSPKMHAFWEEEDPQQRAQETVNFTKNMALLGAVLLAAGHPEPWRWSPTT